jgi:hypothetical protein
MMSLKFAAILFGCTLVGAAGAAYHRAAAPDATAPSNALPQPLFLQAAMETPPAASWPPSGSVAFYEEMFALLTTTATARLTARAPTPEPPVARGPAANGPVARGLVANDPRANDPRANDPRAGTGEPAPQRAGVTPPRGSNTNTTEVVIRDRFGRPIRVERVDRRRFAGPRGYPPPYQRYSPYGPYGPPPYGPYMR